MTKVLTIGFKLDGDLIATRQFELPNYPTEVFDSIRFNDFTKAMQSLVEEKLRTADINRIYSAKEAADRAW